MPLHARPHEGARQGEESPSSGPDRQGRLSFPGLLSRPPGPLAIGAILAHKGNVESKGRRLSAVFLERAPTEGPSPDALEEILRGIWERAIADWPRIAVPPRRFMRYLADRIPARAGALSALPAMHTSDLYLAFGCMTGSRGAIEAFERQHVARIPAYLARGNAPADFIEEVKQRVRTRLFTAEAGRKRRLEAYSGRGPLAAWVRMTAMRIAIDLDRDRDPAVSVGFEAEALKPATTDPELIYLKNQYGALVKQAIEATLASLSPHDATLLRLFFLQQVSHDALARIYHVPKSKVRRWLDEIRERIIEETRRFLVEELGVTKPRLDSVLRLVSSNLDPSIVRFLKRPT